MGTRERLRRFGRHVLPGDLATLDVGCGNGAFTLLAAQRGNRALGIDLNAANIERCREWVAYVGAERARFEVENAYDLAARGETFDQIFAFEILEHLAKDHDMVRLFGRLLRPGGSLHVSTPYLARTPFYGEVLTDVEDGGHLRLGYTFEQLEDMLRAAGLRPVARDEAVGPASRRVLETVNRATELAGTPGGAAALVAGAPARVLDRLVPRAPRLCIYVRGVRA